MTAPHTWLSPTRSFPPRHRPKGSIVLALVSTTDAKTNDLMYLITALGFFLAGGVMALLMRAELAST
jgi:cytochrome c oxidase subunit I